MVFSGKLKSQFYRHIMCREMIVHRNMEISLIYKEKNVGRSRSPISPYFAAVCWDMANIGQPFPNNNGCMKQETIKKQSRNNHLQELH